MNIGLMFPGQGAQYVGMGKSLYDGNRAAAMIYNQARNIIGDDFLNIGFYGPEIQLTTTACCQSMLFTHSCAAVETLKTLYPEKQWDVAWGLSLGELSALYASNVFNFETGLKVVHKRGILMQEACERTKGSMVSLLGGIFDDVTELCDQANVEIANINCPGQIVISGECQNIKHAIEIANKMTFKKVIPLKVAGAYHSRLMEYAREEFKKFLQDVEFLEPKVAVISNVTADFVKTADAIKSLLVKQITSPVLFNKCCERAIRFGVNQIYECGAGKVLSGLMKRIDSDINVKSLDKLSDFNL